MINNNIIKFGYGDILTSHDRVGNLIFRELNYFGKIGEKPTRIHNLDFKDNRIVVSLSAEELSKVYKKLNRLSKKNCQVEIGEYILDFSNYCQKSVGIVKDHIKAAINAIEPKSQLVLAS